MSAWLLHFFPEIKAKKGGTFKKAVRNLLGLLVLLGCSLHRNWFVKLVVFLGIPYKSIV